MTNPRKFICMKYKDLSSFLGEKTSKKRGTPKNEGKSRDVYENKRLKKWPLGSLEMLMKTHGLYVFSVDVAENKCGYTLESGARCQAPGARYQVPGVRCKV